MRTTAAALLDVDRRWISPDRDIVGLESFDVE
jgi:hypothetical protein